MKKIFSILFALIFSFSNVVADPLDEDCKYLETLFSEVAIDMSLSLDEKAISAESVVEEIKTIYKATASAKIEKKEGIDRKAFASAINEIYSKFSINNGHVSVFNKIDNDFLMPFTHCFIYYSDVYFSKENESFVVYENYKNIKKGMLYTGSCENLFKTIHNNQILYRFGTFSSELIKKSKISIENKDFEIQVKGDVGQAKYRADYDFQKIDDNIYLKIEKCNYSDKTLEKQYFTESEKIIEDFKNANNIIFDLRNNLGGYSTYLNQFLYALIYSEKTKQNDLDFSKWSRNLYAGEKRINTQTMIDKTTSKGLAPRSYINYCIENLDTKYIEENKEEKNTVTPWYKGKIFVLMNPLTCSAAEGFILSLKKLFGQNVVIIGQNSQGNFDFVDVYEYILPNSKIQLKLCAVDSRKINLLKEKSWHGDTMGIFPDYWCKPKDIVTILCHFIGNNKLEKIIKL